MCKEVWPEPYGVMCKEVRPDSEANGRYHSLIRFSVNEGPRQAGLGPNGLIYRACTSHRYSIKSFAPFKCRSRRVGFTSCHCLRCQVLETYLELLSTAGLITGGVISMWILPLIS